MDELILEKKVDSILRCLNRIGDRIPDNEHEFLTDYEAQDVVILNLSRAVNKYTKKTKKLEEVVILKQRIERGVFLFL